jgi:hypothetical protein
MSVETHMHAPLLSGTDELAQVFREWCAKAKDIRIVTAWATTDCAVWDSLKNARSKISTMVVGRVSIQRHLCF